MKRLYQNKKQGHYISQFKGFPYKTVLAFAVPILLIFLLSSIMTSIIRNDINNFLSSIPTDASITIDGKAVQDAGSVISALKQIAPLAAHHSHPESIVCITITAKGQTLRLNLGRDSERSNEYWVFYPQYRNTSNNEIGRIITKLFDSYK
jgi:hypothetical protein